jgi:hypothetical protein
MSHIMKALGVRDAAEWAALAWRRPADADAEAIAARREASEQMLTAMRAEPDASFLDDAELLISGRMSFEEHRAYLAEKYKREA